MKMPTRISALDHHEELRRLDPDLARDQRRADLEEREREADGDREREDDLAARQLEVLFASSPCAA